MKIFFSGSYRGNEQFNRHYRKIFDIIGKLGYTHLDSEIIDVDYEKFQKKMSEGRQAYVDHYQKKMQALQKADICVFEVSYHSLGVGFMAERGIVNNKPTIALYYKDNVPYFLSGIDNEKLIVVSYDEKNLNKVLEKTLEQAKIRIDKRFNFFISPKLLNYIDKISKEEGITKSTFIRSLIANKMKENTNR